MRLDKLIVQHTASGSDFAHGIIVSNVYDNSLSVYRELGEEVRKDFPDLDLPDNEIKCFVVTESTCNLGCVGVRFPIPPNTAKTGYRKISQLPFRHS